MDPVTATATLDIAHVLGDVLPTAGVGAICTLTPTSIKGDR